MKKIPCPVCKKSFFKFFLKSGKYQLVQCQNCFLVFINPRPTSREIQKIYSKNYYKSSENNLYSYNNYLEEKTAIQKIFFRRLLKIKQNFKTLPQSPKILDIGCATGFFLELTKNLGWRAEGVEISQWAVDFGRKKLALKIHSGKVEALKVPKEKFDLITAWDVIEHVENLDKFLDAVKKLLKRNGKFILTTPNIQSLTAKINKNNWIWLATPAHLCLFSPQTIKHLLTKKEIQVLKIETEESFETFILAILNLLKITNPLLRKLIKIVLLLPAWIVYMPLSLFFKKDYGGLITVYGINKNP